MSKTPSQQNPAASAASLATTTSEATHARLRTTATRQRVLYTANVGDARIVLCRNGKALRLSYDHKGSDENEGKRVANAGGLILNNRVNGVLAVTRALGDAYMKDLVTGHPYTTETVIQPDLDEFIILACDGVSLLLDHSRGAPLIEVVMGRLLRPRSRRPGPTPTRPDRRSQIPRRSRPCTLQHRQPLLHDRALQ
jgi:serine/threonine protein phosphatase PrpC